MKKHAGCKERWKNQEEASGLAVKNKLGSLM